MFTRVLLSFLAVISHHVSKAWPDGAPCIHSAFESMNPLEAVEHQGGLQLTNPPYTIDVVQKCYWRNQPIELTLRGNTSFDKFRGFAIQPIVYRGPHQGKRMGQFLRLDDNGSWQQQCFRFKDSVTHSHDEKKKHIKLWWKNDLNEEDTIQFVATVVKAQKEFWVKSVLSVPIPPCQLSKDGITDYVPPPVTPPPPVKTFKLDTFRIFEGIDVNQLKRISALPRDDEQQTPKPQRFQDAFESIPVFPNTNSGQIRPTQPLRPNQIPQPFGRANPMRPAQPPQQFRRPFQNIRRIRPPQPVRPFNIPATQLPQRQSQLRQQLPQTIPLSNTPNVSPSTSNFMAQPPRATVPIFMAESPQDVRRSQLSQNRGAFGTFNQQPTQFATSVNDCYDLDPPAMCFARAIYCRDYEYMRVRCKRTCRYC